MALGGELAAAPWSALSVGTEGLLAMALESELTPMAMEGGRAAGAGPRAPTTEQHNTQSKFQDQMGVDSVSTGQLATRGEGGVTGYAKFPGLALSPEEHEDEHVD